MLFRSMKMAPMSYTMQDKNMTGAGRPRTPPSRFADETFLPGANNAHTAGRSIDPYDRSFDQNSAIEEDRHEDWYDTPDPFLAPAGSVKIYRQVEIHDDSGRAQKHGADDEADSGDEEYEADSSDSEEDEEFEVEKVIGTRLGEDGREYKIRWKDYGRKDDTWEHYKNLDCPEAVDTYRKIAERMDELESLSWHAQEAGAHDALFGYTYDSIELKNQLK